MLSVKENNVISKLAKQLVLQPAEIDYFFFFLNGFGEFAMLKYIVKKLKF